MHANALKRSPEEHAAPSRGVSPEKVITTLRFSLVSLMLSTVLLSTDALAQTPLAPEKCDALGNWQPVDTLNTIPYLDEEAPGDSLWVWGAHTVCTIQGEEWIRSRRNPTTPGGRWLYVTPEWQLFMRLYNNPEHIEYEHSAVFYVVVDSVRSQ